MIDRRLLVRLHGRPVGRLIFKDNGNLQFRYDPGYDGPPLSVALPVRVEAYPHRSCEAWFGGLLPEGDVRVSLARTLGTSPGNHFRILNEIGGDCAGAVEILPQEWDPVAPPEQRPPEELSESELDKVIERLLQRPLGIDPEQGIRMSLAGAQPKLPVIFEPTRFAGSGFALPHGTDTPTTHLVKPEPERFPQLVANESFCMTLARACGIDAALTDVRATSSGRRFLLVRRYDRRAADDGTATRRLHQEDFCQALLVRAEDKYQQDGGPSFASMAELLRHDSRLPAEDLFKLWDAAVFNWAIGNCDAHGKNFALLYDDADTPRLAPLYDLVSTAVHPELSKRWAMTLGAATLLDDVRLESWEELARQMRLAPRPAVERARRLLSVMQVEAEHVLAVRGMRQEITESIARRIDGCEI